MPYDPLLRQLRRGPTTAFPGGPPTGPAGGDLSGTYPNPTVARINGAPLGPTTPISGNLLIADGVQWNSVPMSGDATINAAGVVTIAALSLARSPVFFPEETVEETYVFLPPTAVASPTPEATTVFTVPGMDGEPGEDAWMVPGLAGPPGPEGPPGPPVFVAMEEGDGGDPWGGVSPIGATGTGVAGQVAFWGSGSSLAGDPEFVYNAATDVVNAAGQVVVGTLAAPTNASAGIELNSTTKTLLLSRMTTAQKNVLAFTTPGSLLFDSTLAVVQIIETPGVFRTPLVIEGRTGTTNNPVISSTSGGKVTGGNLGNLELQANPGLSSTAFVITNNPTQIDSAINTDITGTYNHMEIAATSFNLGAGSLRAIHYDPIITVIDDVTTVDIFRFQPQFVSAAGTSWVLGTHAAILSGQFYTPGAGSSFTGVVSRGLRYQPVFNNTGVGNVITSSYAVVSTGTLTAAWSVTNTWALGVISDPGASGGLPQLGGLEINDLTSGTANFSIWSKGAGVFLAHAGAAVFGASQSTITAPTAGAIIDAFGNVLINNTGTAGELRLREPSAGGASYTGFVAPALAANVIYTLPTAFPATNGESLTATTAGIMSWAAMQPLDADLTAIAAIAVSEGSLIIGSNVPAWVELVIGSTDLYLRSNGTTAAWAAVTELGTVDTYAGVTLAGKGMPHIVASVDLPGQTANIALNALYAVPADGFYRVSAYVIVTTPASLTSTLPQVNVTWQDGDSAVNQSIVLTGGIGATPTPPPGYASAATQSAVANTTTTMRGGDFVCYANSGTNIQYSTSGYASNAAGMTYSVHIRVEAL